MNLHEYRSKELFAAEGIAVPDGAVARTPAEARAIAQRLGGAIVVKAQVLTGGRGKAGGIVVVHDPQEAAKAAERLLGSTIRELPVEEVLVEAAAQIAQELYVALIVDREAGRVALIVSSEGGVDIEETARTHPDRVHTIHIDPYLGLRPFYAIRAAAAMGLDRKLWNDLATLLANLYTLAQRHDASLAEINPLVVTAEEALLALDAKVTIDDSALFRQPDLDSKPTDGEESTAEARARQMDISYIKLDGDIGCMVNGAGLAMATMDVIKHVGGEPANFLDIGGGARRDRVAAALEIILSDPHVRVVLINIFGGITRCDEVARGIVEALDHLGQTSTRSSIPIVVRLVGTNYEEGQRILEQANLPAVNTLSEGARMAVELADSGGRS
jgi:succinyl-CoA synthetase beta subunit